jgi:hypothetical protein
MKKIATLVLGLCVLTAFAYESTQTPVLNLKADVSATEGNPCMSKKISGKVSPVPRMKCRFS